MKYIPEIDGLRAIAVSSVVLFHLFPDQLSGGFIGVDIFFVISGFLISSIIFNDLIRDTFSLKRFISKRIRRIFPTLLLVLIATGIMGAFILFQTEMRALCKHIAGGTFFVSNFLFANEIGYFDGPAETKPLLHLWSLSIEEQFYLIWPPLLILLTKKRASIIGFTCVIFSLSLAINLFLVKSMPEKLFFLPFGRFWQLLAGAILAWFQSYKPESITSIREITVFRPLHRNFTITLTDLLSTLGLVLLIGGCFYLTSTSLYPGGLALIPTLGTVLIILSGKKAVANKFLLSSKYLISIGLVSYPLYLWHWPIYVYARLTKGEPLYFIDSIAVLLLSIILSVLTYKYFETKIRFSTNRLTAQWLSLSLLIIGISGIFIYKNDGQIPFLSKENSIKSSANNSPLRKKVHLPNELSSLKATASTYFFDNAEIAVVGNSHAVELAYSLANELRPYEKGLYHYTMSSAIHNFGLHSEMNHADENHSISYRWHEKIVGEIERNKEIKLVIFSYRNEYFSAEEIYIHSLAAMMNQISRSKKVIYVLQAPLLEKNVLDYIPRVGSKTASIKSSDLEDWNRSYSQMASVTNQLNESIYVINPTDYFCDENTCYALRDGRALYFDDDHMSLYGASLIAEEIMAYFKQTVDNP